MTNVAVINGEKVRRRSFLRRHPLQQERIAAEQAVRAGVKPKVVKDVTDSGAAEYAREDALVELVMSLEEFPGQKKRPRARFGSR